MSQLYTADPACAQCGRDLRASVYVPSTTGADQDFDCAARCLGCGAEHVVTVYLALRFDVRARRQAATPAPEAPHAGA